MKKILVFTLLLVTMFLTNFSFAENYNPTIFGMEWGSSVKQCQEKGMKATEPYVKDGNITVYVDFNNSDHVLEGIQTTGIGYTFVDEKLCEVYIRIEEGIISTSPYTAGIIFRSYLLKNYGESSSISPMKNHLDAIIGDITTWKVGNVTIQLSLNYARQTGSLIYKYGQSKTKTNIETER